MGIFARIKKAWYDSIIWETIDEDFYDELEESLIMADLGAAVAADAVKELRKVVYEKSIQRGDDVKQALRDILEKKLEVGDTSLDHALLVFRIVIFGVLGNVAEFASNLDALANLGALLGFEVMQLLLELLAALGSKDVIATHFVTPNFKIDSAAKRRPFTKTGTQCVLV